MADVMQHRGVVFDKLCHLIEVGLVFGVEHRCVAHLLVFPVEANIRTQLVPHPVPVLYADKSVAFAV